MRRRTFKKRRYKKRNKGIKKLKRDVKNLKLNTELKYFDDSRTLICDSHTRAWNGQDMTSLIRQGGTSTTRDGSKINLKRCFIRGYFKNDNATPEDTIIRVMIFRARFQNNINQLADMVNIGTNILDARRFEHKKRYKVYFDETFTMRNAAEDNAQSYLPYKVNIPLNSVVQYNGNAGTFADLERNAMWIMVTSTTVVEANCPTMIIKTRLTYYDS